MILCIDDIDRVYVKDSELNWEGKNVQEMAVLTAKSLPKILALKATVEEDSVHEAKVPSSAKLTQFMRTNEQAERDGPTVTVGLFTFMSQFLLTSRRTVVFARWSRI